MSGCSQGLVHAKARGPRATYLGTLGTEHSSNIKVKIEQYKQLIALK